jgi:hypothetical protein
LDDIDRGLVIRDLDAMRERVKAMRMVLRIDLVVCLLVPLMLFLVLSNIYGPTYWMTIFLPVLLLVMSLLGLAVVQFSFSRSLGKVTLYSNGIQFPRAAVHKLFRRSNFLAKESMVSLEVKDSVQGADAARECLYFVVKDARGRSYWSGPRAKADVQAIADYISKEWHVKVDDMRRASQPSRSSTGSIPTTPTSYRGEGARKIAVAPAPTLFCPNCGAQASPSNEFCPMCGHKAGAPVTRYMPSYASPQPSTAPNAPLVQEKSPLPSYMQKSPRLAFMLALIPGIFCIMGLGHFYVRRMVKGFVLLVVGFFIGLFSWVILFMAFTETEYEPAVYAIAAMIFWAPFIAVLLWSAFDAFKQAQKFNLVPPEGIIKQDTTFGGPGQR